MCLFPQFCFLFPSCCESLDSREKQQRPLRSVSRWQEVFFPGNGGSSSAQLRCASRLLVPGSEPCYLFYFHLFFYFHSVLYVLFYVIFLFNFFMILRCSIFTYFSICYSTLFYFILIFFSFFIYFMILRCFCYFLSVLQLRSVA